jgi:site-specific DNA recombinase
MTPPTPLRVVAYCRVSTSKQAKEGVSLEAQQQKLQAYADLFDYTIVEMIVDRAESAKSLDRPELQRALGMLGKTADSLLIPKLDRLTRSVRDIGFLIEKYFQKYGLLSVEDHLDTTTAAGKMLINILTTFGQYEREAIGERTAAAKRYQKSMGRYVGGHPPYGWRREGTTVVKDANEQAAIEDMKARRMLGEALYSIGQVHRTRKGTPMDSSQVRRIISE